MAKQKKETVKTFISTSSYYSDLYDKSTLRAVLVRSPISSGAIRSITIEDVPEGYALFTADDLPNTERINVFSTSFPVLAKEKISYKGEPIGILTGPNLTRLHDLLKSINVVFTEDFTQADTKDASLTQNIVANRKVSYGGTKTLKDSIEHHIETEYTLKLDIDETAETNGALCYAGPKTLNIYTPTVWASNLRKNLTAITGYSSENIIIHKTKLPISEKNAPWKNTTLTIQCALASLLTKKSILLCLSQDEQESYDNYQNSVTVFHDSKISKAGKIQSCDAKIVIDVGAYNPFASIIVDRLTISAMGAYSPKKINIEVIAQTSNNPPGTSVIRWLDYHCFFAIESHMKKIAEEVNIDPCEVRLQNIHNQTKKYLFFLDTAPYKDVLQMALKKSDYFRKYETYKLNPFTKKSKNEFFPVRGIGLATAYEANGFLGAMIDTSLQSLEVTIDKNSKVIIKVLNASTTIASIWKEMASTILSINVEDITIDNIFGQSEEAGVPETMLSNMHITSQLLKKACLALQKLRFHQPLPITVKRTFNLANKKTWNPTTFTGKPFYATSWIALVAEIELNMPIHSFEVRSIWISIDAGTVMNKKKARYAIQSCVNKIISQAMKNQTYAPPDISVTFLPSTDEPKQIRELVYSTLPSAICNALSQTVAQAFTNYPVEQKTIFQHFNTVFHISAQNTIEEEVLANKPINK